MQVSILRGVNLKIKSKNQLDFNKSIRPEEATGLWNTQQLVDWGVSGEGTACRFFIQLMQNFSVVVFSISLYRFTNMPFDFI